MDKKISGSFERKLRKEISASVGDIASTTKTRPMAAGSKFIDIVFRVAREFTAEQLKGMDKATLLQIVGKAYDDYISKIDLPGEFDAIFHTLLKQTAITTVGIAFDRFLAK
jgi:hypothetical protein